MHTEVARVSRQNTLRAGRLSLAGHAYLLTTCTQSRQTLFADFRAARTLARCINDQAIVGDCHVLAWVVMPDHMHLLIQLGVARCLSSFMNGLKGASARQVNLCLGRSGPVWQPAYHDRLLRKEENLVAVARYIVANPVRAGLAGRIGDYPHWDVCWLGDGDRA